MTIGTAYAYIASNHRSMVGILADARLSWHDTTSVDIAVKTHELSPRIAAVSAGAAMVGPAAAELTRSIIGTTIARDDTQVSLWSATRLFAHFARVVQRPLRDVRGNEIANEFVITGFYKHGAPGVALVELTPAVERVADDLHLDEAWDPGKHGEVLAISLVNVGEASDRRLATKRPQHEEKTELAARQQRQLERGVADRERTARSRRATGAMPRPGAQRPVASEFARALTLPTGSRANAMTPIMPPSRVPQKKPCTSSLPSARPSLASAAATAPIARLPRTSPQSRRGYP